MFICILNYLRNLTHTVFQFLVVNNNNAHLSSHCAKLNKGRRRCTEIILKILTNFRRQLSTKAQKKRKKYLVITR